jgi:hypothetical protein
MPLHTTLLVHEFLAKNCIPMLLLAPYSPYLSHCAFYWVKKLKLRIKGYHLQTLDTAQKAVTDAIKTLTEANVQSCYKACKIRWAKCAALEGCYFQGNNVDLDE